MSGPLERLKHHVTGAIERGESKAIVERRPYFAEGTEAMLALEAMVDRVGISNVLYALAHISRAKSEYVETNWQDRGLAVAHNQNANKLDKLALRLIHL